MLSKSNHQIIDGVTITLEASFGCLQTPIRKNCLFVNDDTLMFISGKHIVLYDIIRKRQTYIMKSAEDESVQTLNFYLTSSNKLLIALGFKSTNKILPTVKVYNRKKKRFYQCVHSHLLPGTNVFEILFINSGKVPSTNMLSTYSLLAKLKMVMGFLSSMSLRKFQFLLHP